MSTQSTTIPRAQAQVTAAELRVSEAQAELDGISDADADAKQVAEDNLSAAQATLKDAKATLENLEATATGSNDQGRSKWAIVNAYRWCAKFVEDHLVLVVALLGVFGAIFRDQLIWAFNALFGMSLGFGQFALIPMLPLIIAALVGIVFWRANKKYKDGDEFAHSRSIKITVACACMLAAITGTHYWLGQLTGNVAEVAIASSTDSGSAQAPSASVTASSFDNLDAVNAASIYGDNSFESFLAFAGWKNANGEKVSFDEWLTKVQEYDAWNGDKSQPSVYVRMKHYASIGVEKGQNGLYGRPGNGAAWYQQLKDLYDSATNADSVSA